MYILIYISIRFLIEYVILVKRRAGRAKYPESSIDAEPTESHLGDLLASLDYSSKCLRIAHINICSLRNKLDELKVLQELCKFDMIGITGSQS